MTASTASPTHQATGVQSPTQHAPPASQDGGGGGGLLGAIGGKGPAGALGAFAAGAVGTLGGAGAATAAGEGALVAASAYLGYQETHSDLGALAGAHVGPGTAATAGWALGVEVDHALGGQPGSLSSDWQGGVLAISGWLAVFFPVGTILAIGVFLNGEIIYGFISGITDLVRLQYGQAGAKKDLAAKFVEVETHYFDELQRNPNPVTSAEFTSDENVHRYSYPLADGYVQHSNRLAYRRWLLDVPWGLGVTNIGYHAKWGSDRGYYVGTYGDVSEPNNEPIPNSFSPDMVPFLAASPEVPKLHPESIASYGNALMTQNLMEIGRRRANLDAWVDWNANGARGAFVGDVDHATYGANHGYFEGSVEQRAGQPVLLYKGVYFWKDGRELT